MAGLRPSVMAFDLAGRTGVAFGRVGEIPRAHALDLGKKGTQGERLAALLHATQTLLERNRPDIVAYEEAVGGPKTSHRLVEMIGAFLGQAHRSGFKPHGVPIGTIRKHFLGKALNTTHFPGLTKSHAKEAIKSTIIARCGALGWAPRNDDEADAMALWDYACSTYGRGQSVPVGGLFDRAAS